VALPRLQRKAANLLASPYSFSVNACAHNRRSQAYAGLRQGLALAGRLYAMAFSLITVTY
jgi:hypothetical protein